ncbi:MAG: glycosyltransferase [Candidatus Sulfotelmatobacter sp.]|jgi:glycosyltransferase involved in cell wall biosynthesis
MNTSSQPDRPPTMPTAELQPVLASVVIPAYNCSDCIVEALNSALEQTFSEFEVIVVNDGSPDTPQLEQALEPYRERIRYIKQENQGPSGARNTGILAARGKYVAFLDSDDLWRPGHLARQIALLEANSCLGLVYADAMLTVNGVPVRTYFEDCPQSHPVTFESLVKEECSVITSATVARRDALVQAGLFDGQFRRCEDFDLWTRIVHCGFQVDYVREVQIVHRSRNGLSSDAESMKRSLAAVYKKMSQLPVSEIQKDLILARQARAEAELQLELCRKSLLAGDHVQARATAEAALRVLDNWRLRLAVVALRVAPLPFAAGYRAYARILARRRRARLERLRKFEWQQLGVHGK